MPKHIGIVACSAEGAALCYRTLCTEAAVLMGEHNHPEISMHTPPLADYIAHLRNENWSGVSALMLNSARKLASIGAQFAICPDNTIHQAFDMVSAESPIPWLHIAEAVADEAQTNGWNQLALLGTRYLMTGPVYPDVLQRYRIAYQIPDAEDREKIDTIIFKELVNGIFLDSSRAYFNDVITKLKTQGCDAAVLGCTEIPLLVEPDGCSLPVLDSTRLLARAALRFATK